MRTCTFFGHRRCSQSISNEVKACIVDLIKNKGVDLFYVGNNGAFDCLVRDILMELESVYDIKYYVVLAYMPGKSEPFSNFDWRISLYPDGLEKVPPKFAIDWRNKWMLKQSEFVVVFIEKFPSNALKYAEMAAKKGKKIISLGKSKYFERLMEIRNVNIDIE